jgi:hypothetical protein
LSNETERRDDTLPFQMDIQQHFFVIAERFKGEEKREKKKGYF